MKTVAIVGGGLSGMTACLRLQEYILKKQETALNAINIILLEKNDRLGGRIMSDSGVDLGAAWTWQSHDRALNDLFQAVGVGKELQSTEGMAIKETRSSQIIPAGMGLSPAGEGSFRIKNTAHSIVSQIVAQFNLQLVNIKLNTLVTHITETSTGSVILEMKDGHNIRNCSGNDETTELNKITVDVVIMALPPKIAVHQIQFKPILNHNKATKMKQTPIWMSNTGKVAFLYHKPFWRESHTNSLQMSLSGTVFSQKGPLRQIWDNSASDGSVYALAGFIFDDDLLLLQTTDCTYNDMVTRIKNPKHPIMEQMMRLFGEEALNPTKIVFKDWTIEFIVKESCMSLKNDDCTPYNNNNTNNGNDDDDCINIDFGHPMVSQPHGSLNQIIFAGTETAAYENGHMNGAVLSGERATKEAIHVLELSG